MLNILRQNSRSFLVYALFGLLIAAFVITIAPSSMSRKGNFNSGDDRWLMKLGNQTIDSGEFISQLRMEKFRIDDPIFLRTHVSTRLHVLLPRLLLAKAAKKNGLQVAEEEINKELYSGIFYLYGAKQTLTPPVYKEGVLDYEKFRSWVQINFAMTVPQFISMQIEELLAFRYAKMSFSPLPIGDNQLNDLYLMENTKVKANYVSFPIPAPGYESFANDRDFNTALKTYVTANQSSLRQLFDKRDVYLGEEPKAHIRKIVTRFSKDSKDPNGSKEQVKKQLESTLAAINADPNPVLRFATEAQKQSKDMSTAGYGGHVGWIKKGKTSFIPAVENAIFSAKPGQLLGPFEKEDEFSIFYIQDIQKGPISFDSASYALAEEPLMKQKSEEVAFQQANEYLGKLKSGQSLESLFPQVSNDEEERKPFAQRAKKIETTQLISWVNSVPMSKTNEALNIEQAMRKDVFSPHAKQGDGFVIRMGNAYYLVVIDKKEVPALTDFTEQKKLELRQKFKDQAFTEAQNNWLETECLAKEKDGTLNVNDALLNDILNIPKTSNQSNIVGSAYSPCKIPSWP